jgi:hypothetical protein
MSRDEIEARAVFSERYAAERQDVNREIERAVIGGDWGANGYTTLAQADDLGQLAAAGRGRRLADVGAGRGWPGLYLAASTGCSVVLSDLPAEGLVVALRRATVEGLSDRVVAVSASARYLPLRDGSVDGIVSSDVFC